MMTKKPQRAVKKRTMRRRLYFLAVASDSLRRAAISILAGEPYIFIKMIIIHVFHIQGDLVPTCPKPLSRTCSSE